jgi:hypothetical protein
MSSRGRGGRRPGAGRKPKSYDILEIIAEVYCVRAEYLKKQGDRICNLYWPQFRAYEFVNDAQTEMKKWPADSAAARDKLEDARSMLDQRTGPNGRQLRGTHSIVVPRLYGVRSHIFEVAAKRLKERHGWRIGASRVERVWKEWRHRQKLESMSIL